MSQAAGAGGLACCQGRSRTAAVRAAGGVAGAARRCGDAAAREALAAGRPGTAFAIFMREIAGLRSPLVAPAAFGMNRGGRRIAGLVERQLDDNEAIDALGCRLAAYRKVGVPVLLLEGERGPRHLRDRTDALEEALPVAVRVVLAGQGHTAERSAPGRVAEVIAGFLVRPEGVPPRGIG